ncbi:MAG TPA: CsgG/HfaB family protein [Verrucomicrobiae bacterium]|jgi:curli biogenesis system outer membrane secretion channel CsgG
MNNFLAILLLAAASTPLGAQPSPPAKLAVLALSQDAAPAADLLTAELSSNPKVAVLERNEIEKVYREQALSQAGRNYLKVGQVLGADGLLLLDAQQRRMPGLAAAPFGMAPAPQELKVRLIAVKTGILLSAETVSIAANDLPDWTKRWADSLNVLIEKLTLERADAIPISLVNLRAAASSDRAAAEERQLKALAIERLARERQLIVLERQRMQLLAEEKALNLDESAFWAGSYLLDGAIDPNGYNKDTMTVRFKLTPPKGGAPISLEVSGPRDNLAEVVNQLAVSVDKALNVKNAAPPWNAAAEAAQYFDELKWALRWGIAPEAQAAAESAWALGKRDTECGILRVQTYLADIPAVLPPGQSRYTLGKPDNFVNVDAAPNPANCDTAIHAMELYNEGLLAGLGAQPIADPRYDPNRARQKLDWFSFGVEALNSASGVLYQYNDHPALQQAVADKLAELRAELRRAAAGIAANPAVRASYFIGDRLVTGDEAHQFADDPLNFYACEVKWGCFWQERPEDAIAMYRELAGSPMFSHVHQMLWMRAVKAPRLVGWNAEQRQAIPALWRDFVRELADSPDLLHQLEAKAFKVADSAGPQKDGAFANLFHALAGGKAVLLTNNADVYANAWGIGALAPAPPLSDFFSRECWPQLQALEQERNYYTVPALKSASIFEQQKAYLTARKPFNLEEFARAFRDRNYSKAQAREISSLMAAYIDGMKAEAEQALGPEKFRIQSYARFVELTQQQVNSMASVPAPPAQAAPPPALSAAPPTQAAKLPAPAPMRISSNILTVTRFLEIPLASLQTNAGEYTQFGGSIITAHHWAEGKLVLDLKYAAFVSAFDKNTNVTSTRNAGYPAAAILDPASGRWEVASCAETGFITESPYYDHTTLWHGQLFTCNGQKIQRCDLDTKTWTAVDVSDGNNCQLFNVAGHLYGASDTAVFEILRGGKSTRLLASARREPPLSVLDSQQWGTPALFEGPGQSLRIHTADKIFSWTGSDWSEDGSWPAGMSGARFMPSAHSQFLPDGALFIGASILRIPADSTRVETCLAASFPSGRRGPPFGGQAPRPVAKPLWEAPRGLAIRRTPVTWLQSNLYLLEDHSTRREIVDSARHVITGTEIEERDGYHAILHCFEPGLAEPVNIPLRFSAPLAAPPENAPDGWMLAAGDWLFLGTERLPMNFAPTLASHIKYRMGIWAVPFAELQPLLASAQKEQTTPP